MRKAFSSIFVAIMSLHVIVVAQSYPANMNNYAVSATSTVNFSNASINLEIPPWQIPGTWHMYFFSTGAKTNTYSDPNDMISHTNISVVSGNVDLAVQPDLSKPWKRNYFEIYSAHYFNHVTQGPINLGFCHGENKNLCNFQNTINPNVPYYCPDNGNQWLGYYAIPSAVWTTSTAANNWGQTGFTNELGPIIWPSNGFIAPDNASATEGMLHPSSIIANGMLYIFLYDSGPTADVTNAEGRGRGIKVVRVTQENSLDPTKYQVYYKDPSGNVSWLSSLPTGFTKETMLSYTHTLGPKSTDIIPDELSSNTHAFRFSVAHVSGQNYYIGCEEYVDDNDGGRHHVALRFSYDLVNWSVREKIVETSTNWDASQFNYPIFLSSDGWSNTELNLNSFYVVGTHSQSPFPSIVNRVNISVVTPPPPPPPPNCGTPGKPPCVIQSITAMGLDSTASEGYQYVPQIFNFYPNPTDKDFTFTYYMQQEGKLILQMYNSLGQLVKFLNYREGKGMVSKFVNISSLPTGLYFISLINEKGQVNTGKIIKQ